jgi:hypothetical protein
METPAMTSRALRRGAVVAVALAAAFAQGPGRAQSPPAERLAEMAARPTPRLSDGRLDLNGTWDHVDGIAFLRPQQLEGGSLCLLGCGPAPAAAARDGGAGARGGGAGGPAPAARPAPDFPKYKPEFLAKVKDLSDRQVETDTVLQCQPPGVPRIGPPRKIVQNARELVFLYDDVSGAFFRIVPTDGRPHRKDLPASYLGDAVGRWEGDTLVVETTNFNEETWLTDNGAFHTSDLRVLERFRRVGDTIEYQAIVHDPAVLAEPWAVRPQTIWIADREMEEPVHCQDRDLDHVVDGTFHANPR